MTQADLFSPHAELRPDFAKRAALAALQCHKRLWWEENEPATEEPSPIAKYRMREGIAVGMRARDYVPGAKYEAAFSANGWMARADILEPNGDAWTLTEVKATTSVSAGEHIPDITYQAAVLRAAGVSVKRYEIMHLNRDCKYPDLTNLFTRSDVTDKVLAGIDDMDRVLAEATRIVAAPTAPQVMTGDHCSSPRECPFMSRCWAALPKHHVTTLYAIRKKSAAKYVEQGYHTIDQLPDDLKLNVIHSRQRRAIRQGEVVVERDALVSALATLTRPVAHLDFETVQPAIPRWDGCHPYDQIPVQLSCHVVNEDGSVTHHAWLYDGDGDPRPDAARAILDACRGARTVTAYYSSFEKSCIQLVADACPEFAGELLPIASTIVDLLPIVREHVYHPEFGGSFSLKKVLPALVPALSYSGLRIREGETAQIELSRMIFSPQEMSAEQRAELRAALLEYCELDTKAMVALEERLRGMAE
jgi:predicted RecB family nuclease